ncbi:MAG TPA: hypothetical protein VJV39_21415 [Dongiaceae bacterium]|nr:hypothetical protein [Dongiaceae bacterium]
MTAFVHLVRLLAAIGIVATSATAALAQSSETPGATGTTEQPAASPPANADWPCEQPLRGEMSIGAMWQGPDPAGIQEDWHKTPTVVALVNEIAPRRVPQEDAVANVRRFAAGYQGEERAKIMTQVFAGLFDTLSAERNQIVRGIKRFYRRQDALAKRMEEGWKMLGEIDPNSTDPKLVEQRAAIQQQIDWDSRVFDDRQRLLPVVCEQPRVIEQRVFALSRELQEQLAVTQ